MKKLRVYNVDNHSYSFMDMDEEGKTYNIVLELFNVSINIGDYLYVEEGLLKEHMLSFEVGTMSDDTILDNGISLIHLRRLFG